MKLITIKNTVNAGVVASGKEAVIFSVVVTICVILCVSGKVNEVVSVIDTVEYNGMVIVSVK